MARARIDHGRAGIWAVCLCFAVAVPLSGASPTVHLSDRVFQTEALVRLPLPTDAEGKWAILDDRADTIRSGSFREGERTLYLGDLPRGIYYLHWGIGAKGPVEATSAPGRRVSFLVLPPLGDGEPDPFFMLGHPGLAALLGKADAGALAEYTFVLDVAQSVGATRLQTRVTPVYTREEQDAFDWLILDRLLDDTQKRGIALTPALGGEWRGSEMLEPAVDAEKDAAFVQALKRRFGFKIEDFALWTDVRSERFAADGAMHERLGPVYRMLKERQKDCRVALGGIARSTDGAGFSGDSDTLRAMLTVGADLYDILDFESGESLAHARVLARTLDEMLVGTPAAGHPRAVSRLQASAGDDSIAAQRLQAAEVVKQLVWFRFAGYRHATVGPVLDSVDSEGDMGIFSRGADGFLEPRMLAPAWAEARVRLSGATPVERGRFEGEEISIHAFARQGHTILVAWVPRRATGGSVGQIAATFLWPDASGAEAYDMLGRPVAEERLKRRSPGATDAWLDSEPLYIEIEAPSTLVGW